MWFGRFPDQSTDSFRLRNPAFSTLCPLSLCPCTTVTALTAPPATSVRYSLQWGSAQPRGTPYALTTKLIGVAKFLAQGGLTRFWPNSFRNKFVTITSPNKDFARDSLFRGCYQRFFQGFLGAPIQKVWR